MEEVNGNCSEDSLRKQRPRAESFGSSLDDLLSDCGFDSLDEDECRQLKFAIFSFINPARTVRRSYTSQKELICRRLCEHDWFQKGYIWHTFEKGVLFPVVHFFRFASPDYISRAPMLHSNSLGEDYIVQQAVYEQLHKVEVPVIVQKSRDLGTDTLRSTSSRASSNVSTASPPAHAYILLAFKTLDTTFNDVLENNWKEWSGARQIYMNLSPKFGLSQMLFYRRVTPKDFNSFMYILVVVCTNVTEHNHVRLLDFVQQLRISRMLGYLTVYGNFKNNVHGFGSSTSSTVNSDRNSLTPVDI